MVKCIVIPAYNEGKNLNILLTEIFKTQLEKLKVLIIDDSKHSYENQLKFKNDKIIYLHRGIKLGRGSAVLYGIEHMLNLFDDVELFIEMDADLSHNPNELCRNISFFKNENLDLLISSRYKVKSKIINWSLKRKLLSFLSNKLIKFVLKIPISDYTNGYRIYSKNAAKFITKNCGKIGGGFIILSEILVNLYYKNFKINEIETVFVNRIRGESNVTIKEILFSLVGLYRIWKQKKIFSIADYTKKK